ncbi:hypothetical protein CGRA01v4_09153 [Colletotrichum graminicola]|nr:hypothetical protein CGRA01v4_09153 [Colletotrichum graminicola]
MPLIIRRSPLKLPATSAVHRRYLSFSPVSRARIIHTDTDTFIRYSLLQGPPRTPRVKFYRTNLTVRPPKIGAAAEAEHRVLDEVARQIISSHCHRPCRKAVSHVKASSPVFDSVGAGLGPMDNQTCYADDKMLVFTRKTTVNYCIIITVATASALAGYLTRCWKTSNRSIESGGSGWMSSDES